MDLAEYSREAMVTAVFNPIHHVTYPTLGLCDETAEFVEKLLDTQYGQDEVAKEAGDVLWYLNCVCDYSALHITELFNYEKVCNPVDLLIIAGKIAGVAKKTVRDNNGVVNQDKMFPPLVDFSAAFLHLLSVNIPEYSLEEIMDMNIAKLRDRQARNVIRGEGDYR